MTNFILNLHIFRYTQLRPCTFSAVYKRQWNAGKIAGTNESGQSMRSFAVYSS